MSKHQRVRYKGLRERRRWAIRRCQQALGLTPPTLSEARKLWRSRRKRRSSEQWAELRQRYAGEGRP